MADSKIEQKRLYSARVDSDSSDDSDDDTSDSEVEVSDGEDDEYKPNKPVTKSQPKKQIKKKVRIEPPTRTVPAASASGNNLDMNEYVGFELCDDTVSTPKKKRGRKPNVPISAPVKPIQNNTSSNPTLHELLRASPKFNIIRQVVEKHPAKFVRFELMVDNLRLMSSRDIRGFILQNTTEMPRDVVLEFCDFADYVQTLL